VLLHAKFLSTFPDKAAEELERGQHYAPQRANTRPMPSGL
jgi:hypothetical protein